MPIEIERKFIVDEGKLPPSKKSTRLEQGYIDRDRATVRVRVSGDECFLTIKGATSGKSRLEYEYAIPLSEGRELIQLLCGQPVIEKTRHLIDHGAHTWEVDVFDGENAGLVVAEVELDAEDEAVALPEWVTREVTNDRKYSNAALAVKPYAAWTEEEKSGS